MKALPTTEIVNGIEMKAHELALEAYEALPIWKGNKVDAINNTLYFFTGEKDFSKHIQFKVSAAIYLDAFIDEFK